MRNKYIVGFVAGVVTIGIVGGGFLWLHGHHGQPVSYGATSINTDDSQSVSGGLGVATPSGAYNLGQLTGSQNSSGSTGTATQGQQGSSSSSSSVDPSTFSQYDKYKNGTSALFGDIQVGSGTTLTSGHKASVLYKGWLTNGQLFDESKTDSNGQAQPFVFTLGAHQVITGWEEGVAGMKVGGTRLIIVPPAVGYGSTAQGSIPANSVLVFEVQLLSVQ